MSRTRLAVLVLAASLLATSTALAGQRRNRAEKATDHVERADNRHDTADDVRDLRRLDALVDAWHSARQRGDRAAEATADAGIEQWVRGELRESKRDVNEARGEVARSQNEVDASRRERNRSARRGQVIGTADDQRDLRDDRRDAADDRSDLRKDQADLQRTRAIARELEQIQPAFAAGDAGPRLAAQKSDLLRELQRLAKAEIARDVAETREDNRELREDRRETREDRRRR